MDTDERHVGASADGFTGVTRGLWVEEPAVRYRMPDPVRRVAVRSVIIMSVTLIQAMIAFLSTLAGSWLAFPMVISSVASTVVATWGVLDVWVTRQVWNQRHGVVSVPSSTARQLRRDRRRARSAARREVRDDSRIPSRRPGRDAGSPDPEDRDPGGRDAESYRTGGRRTSVLSEA